MRIARETIASVRTGKPDAHAFRRSDLPMPIGSKLISIGCCSVALRSLFGRCSVCTTGMSV
jgi:hypothetical protein